MHYTKKPTVPLHDFRKGSVIQVSRNLQHPLQAAVETTLHTSFREHALVALDGTPFRIHADLSLLGDGNACLTIDTRFPLGKDHVPVDTVLCSLGVSCQLATAPLVWRWIINRYLRYVATAPFGTQLEALGLMPQTTPWLCGFSPRASDFLTEAERQSLLTVTELAGLFLLRQCEEGVRQAGLRGPLPSVDPKHYLELRNWAD